MRNDIQAIIADMLFENFNDKMNKDVNIEEWLNEKTKDELIKTLKLYSLIKNDKELLSKTILLNGRKKVEIVKYFYENYEEIYVNIISYLGEDIINQLNNVIKNCKDGYIEDDIYSMRYSINFFLKLRKIGILNVKYSKKSGFVDAFIQKDIFSIIKKFIKDKNCMKVLRKNSKLENTILSILSMYGILPLSKLTEIVNKNYIKIDYDDLFSSLCIYSIIGEDFNLLNGDDYLIADHNFEDEDAALSFYYSLDDELDYKEFSKKDINDFYNCKYHHKFKQFVELKNFILTTFDMSEEEFKVFDSDLIMDYIYSFQLDQEVARENLKKNLGKYFDCIEKLDKAYIMKAILEIAKLCPTFYLKGYAVSEDKINDNII